MNVEAIEQEAVDVAIPGPRVTPGDIEGDIATEWYFTAGDGVEGATGGDMDYSPELRWITFCVLVLRNGFTVTGESACVRLEDFDADLGCLIARRNAVDKVWPLMGYALKDRLSRE